MSLVYMQMAHIKTDSKIKMKKVIEDDGSQVVDPDGMMMIQEWFPDDQMICVSEIDESVLIR